MKRNVALLLLIAPAAVMLAFAMMVLQLSLQKSLAVASLAMFLYCDMWYMLRMVLDELFYRAEKLWGKPRDLFATSVLGARVWLSDIDRNGHFNNARFLRECGFGRRDLWHRNGVWDVIVSHGGNFVIATQTVRYRRELSLFQAYQLETRVLCWDKRAFYVEHLFVTSNSDHGRFVNAIAIVKNTVLGPVGPEKIMEALHPHQGRTVLSPEMPREVALWNECNMVSSERLRKLRLRSDHMNEDQGRLQSKVKVN